MPLPHDAAKFKLAVIRSEALLNFYSAERRAGACPIEANERMSAFADRLDRIYAEQLQAVKTEMGASK